jgi:hypothetical protein
MVGTYNGDPQTDRQARAELSTALAFYRDLDMTFWLPETEVALAQIVKEHEGYV